MQQSIQYTVLPKSGKPISCGASGTRAFVIAIQMLVMVIVLLFVGVKLVICGTVLVENVIIQVRDTSRIRSTVSV